MAFNVVRLRVDVEWDQWDDRHDRYTESGMAAVLAKELANLLTETVIEQEGRTLRIRITDVTGPEVVD